MKAAKFLILTICSILFLQSISFAEYQPESEKTKSYSTQEDSPDNYIVAYALRKLAMYYVKKKTKKYIKNRVIRWGANQAADAGLDYAINSAMENLSRADREHIVEEWYDDTGTTHHAHKCSTCRKASKNVLSAIRTSDSYTTNSNYSSYRGMGYKSTTFRKNFNTNSTANSTFSNKFFLGFKFSGGCSAPLIDDSYNVSFQNSLTSDEFKLLFIYDAGFILRYDFIELGVQYAERKHFLSSNVIINTGGTSTLREQLERNRFGYLQIPLSFNFPLGSGEFHVGTYMGIIQMSRGEIIVKDISSSNTNEYVYQVNYQELDKYPEYGYNKEPFNNLDIGVLGGLSFPLAEKLNLGLRYYHGINNLNNQANWSEENTKFKNKLNHGGLTLNLTYYLGF